MRGTFLSCSQLRTVDIATPSSAAISSARFPDLTRSCFMFISIDYTIMVTQISRTKQLTGTK